MNPYINDSDFQLYVGDVREVLAELEPESVHCVVTSPPYFGLRDYSAVGQLGLEESPVAYVEAMVGVFRQVRRVMRHDAVAFVNMGDSYLPGKQLAGIPWRLAFALQDDGWILRSDIIWAKPNPMPESVTDRPTKAHEYVFLLTKSPRYYWDADAVREPHQGSTVERYRYGGSFNGGQKHEDDGTNWGDQFSADRSPAELNPAGRNLRSVWEIATEPYPDAHFATFPQALVEPCVKASTSEKGCCPECGSPWVRVVERERPPHKDTRTPGAHTPTGDGKISGEAMQRWLNDHPPQTTGWKPSCDHEKLRTCPFCGHTQSGNGRCISCGRARALNSPSPAPCTVLDPFLGSGTTALVARKHGRRSIGIELSPEYAKLAANRLSQLSLLAEPA